MTVKNNTTLIRNILYLLEAVESGTLSRTAQANGIKISNLSKLIKDLEEYFETPLLIRQSTGVKPTLEGSILISYAQELQNALNKLQQVKEKTISPIKLFAKNGVDINLSSISSSTKIIKSNNIEDCDIIIEDINYTTPKYFKKCPINLNQGAFSIKLALFYKDTLENHSICQQISASFHSSL